MARTRLRLLCASLCFLAAAPFQAKAADWSDYQIIMWQPQSVAAYRALQQMGFTAAALIADRDHPERLLDNLSDPLIQADMRWYVENAATDFYSAYHRYSPGHPPNWRFLAAQQLYVGDRNDPAALIRDPSLSDPSWLGRIAVRLRTMVEANRPYRPLFYNLADEAGIADLNAFWDFDFSQPSLAAMRTWLKSRYGSLAALNLEWGARFPTWEAVLPPTTPQTMRRTDDNYAAWSDFKAWMDVAFARAFAAGRSAVAAADPDALAGMEGGQKPGWGGYNYATLAPSVDVMETESELFPLVHSLNPALRLLSTSFGTGAVEEHRIWRALLDGGRGIIVWDAKHQFVGQDGAMGERGAAAASYLRELRDGLGALLINSGKAPSPVAILYSPESMRVQWLRDWKQKGDAWLSRGAEAEDQDDNTVRNAMDAFERGFQTLGYSPAFVTPHMIDEHALDHGVRVLVLPHAIALSAATDDAIRRFASSGGIVLADTMPGVYDEHGRGRGSSPLSAVFPDSHDFVVPQDALSRHPDADPPLSIAPAGRERLARVLEKTGLHPEFRVRGEDGLPLTDAQVWVFHDGATTLLAVLRDAPSVGPERAVIDLPRDEYAYDIRRGQPIEKNRRLDVLLPDAGPLVLALSPSPPASPILSVTWIHGRPQLQIAREKSDSAIHVLHVALIGDQGPMDERHSSNIVVRSGSGAVTLPWTSENGATQLQVTDLLTGQILKQSLDVAH